MICPHCHQPACTATAALIDGQQVCTWSDEYRHECEARHILSLPTLTERRNHLYGKYERVHSYGKWLEKCTQPGIKQRRGDAALKQMEATMRAVWDSRQR